MREGKDCREAEIDEDWALSPPLVFHKLQFLSIEAELPYFGRLDSLAWCNTLRLRV